MVIEVVGNQTDILLMSETKLDDTFPLSPFVLEGFSPPYRFDRKVHSRDVMLFVREDIPFKLLRNVNPSGNIENVFVKISLRSKDGLFQAPVTLMSVLFKITQSI